MRAFEVVRNMRTIHGARALVCGVLAIGACRADVEHESLDALSRVSPSAVSTRDAWRLFDRSIASGFVPTDDVVTVELERSQAIVAIKVRGGSPYAMHVRGRGGVSLGFQVIDLSALSAGWHTILTNANASTTALELTFVAKGEAVAVPELELWTTASNRARRPNLALLDATDDVALFKAPEASRQIDPGTCAAFTVELTRTPALFRRVHLAYDSIGLLRPFAIERSTNGRAAVGGAWVRAPGAIPRSFIEEIDPESLVLGKNTLRFCLPVAAAEPVTLSDVRVIGELDRGDDHVTKATIGPRDASAMLDGRAETTVPLAPGERLRLELDRLVAPDAIWFDASSSVSEVGCIAIDGAATSLTFEDVDGALRIVGGASACAVISLAVHTSVSIGHLTVVGSGAAERTDWPRIVVTSAAEHFGAFAWVSGFVARPPVMIGTVRVDVAALSSDPTTGEFGQLVKRTLDRDSAWSVDVAAFLPDGSKPVANVMLDANRMADLAVHGNANTSSTAAAVDQRRFGALGAIAAEEATLLATTRVRLGTHAGIDIPAGAVLKPTVIKAKRLDGPTLPPLDPGMINVTAPQGQGYEFLPHGQRFAKEAEVIVPFDPRLIPEGMTADDVHTYFYDEKARRWRKLRRASIDLGERTLRSATDHFTIMVNAVLAVPTSPTPLSFDPTALSSVAAASPAAGIDLIEPPSANSMGDARLGLPIRLPAGRGAYSPSLAINYSSSGDNGWLGVGWDLSISRIEIDTRWGVPTYANGEEVRYLLDGTQLVPTLEVEGPTCMGGRRYRARTEGSFTHVLRCGTNASNFYWIVTDRDGTRFMYGRDSTGVTGNASLASYRERPCGSPPCGYGIYRWHLREVTDTYGNKTHYTYYVDNITGAEPAREVYPQRIDYTSHSTKPAAYSVELILDNHARVDKLVNARSGFKRMVRKLLRSIRVRFQGSVVRDYVLTYAQGQFQKSVLTSVRVFGFGGCSAASNPFTLPACSTEFHEHTFKYHSDTEAFDTMAMWCGEQSGTTCTMAPNTSSLTKGKSTTWAGGLSIGAEFGGVVTLTAGVSGSTGDRDERVGMYDINGDGLVDQVYYDGSVNGPRVLYNAGNRFDVAPSTTIKGLSELGNDENRSWSVNASAGIKAGGFGASATGGFSSATSRAKKIFTDLDGDGFIDFLDATGTSLSSRPVPGGQQFEPIAYEAITQIDPTEDPLLDEFADEIEQRALPVGPALQWIAPYSGTVTVSGTILLGQNVSSDGVNVGLYHADQLLAGWHMLDSSAPVTFERTVQVTAGDSLFLYATTGEEGKSGTVLLDLVGLPRDPLHVRYTSACTDLTCSQTISAGTGVDPMGLSPFHFTSNELTVVGQPIRVPYAGTVRVRGFVNKQRSSAPLRYCLQRFPGAATRTDWTCNDASSPATNVSGTVSLDQDLEQTTSQSWDVAVSAGDLVVLRAEADYSFIPYSLSFDEGQFPRLQYAQACIPNEQGTCTMTTGSEAAGIPLDHESFGFFAAPVSAPRASTLPLSFVAGHTGSYVLMPFANPLGAGPIRVAYRTNLQGTLKNPAPFACTTTCSPSPSTISLQAGESLSIEITKDVIAGTPPASNVQILSNGFSYNVPLIFRETRAAPLQSGAPFAGGFRGWKATFWNETIPFAPTALLAKYEDLYALPGCAPPPGPPPDAGLCAASLEEVARTAVRPAPVFDGTALTSGNKAWVAPNSSAFIVPQFTTLHAASIGGVGGSTSHPDAATPGGGLFDKDYVRLSGTRSYYAGVGVSGSDSLPLLSGLVPGLNATVTRSSTKTSTDILDMTGDGIPDVISGKSVYKGTIGSGVASPKLGFSIENLRHRNGTDYSVSSSVSASLAVTSPTGRRRMESLQKSGSGIGVGTSAGLSVGRSQTTDDLVDINGDGLPDVVQRRGTQIKVRYNLGTDFGAWETIGTVASAMNEAVDGFQNFEMNTMVFNDLLDTTKDALGHDTTLTEHKTFSIDLVLVSGSKTKRKTSSRTTRQLADLNGDGLPDLLFKKHGQPIRVQFNRGVDFGPVRTWDGPPWQLGTTAMELSPSFDSKFDTLTKSGTYALTGADVLAATSTQESTTWAGGIKIPIPGPLAIGADLSRSSDEDTFELGLLDIDGDGDPDHVLRRKQGNEANRFYVKRNLITDRANRLIEVKRPLGATIKLSYGFVSGTVAMPQTRTVLASLEVDDGVDLGSTLASPNTTAAFTYEEGYFDRLEKEFFGFAKVTTRRADDGTTEQVYENASFVLRGVLKQETRKDSAAAVLYERRYQYQVKDVIGPLGVVTAAPTCVAGLHELQKRIPNSGACTPKFPTLVREDEIIGEIGTTITKTRTQRALSHDRFGNVLTSDDLGDAAVLTDDLHSTVAYLNDTSRWILGRPTSIALRAGGLQGPLLRSRSGVYTAEGKLRELSIQTGVAVAITKLQYDAFGNLQRLETPPNAHNETQTYAISFDTPTATYPVTVADGFGYTSSATYDLRFGVSTTETDTNGSQLVRALDGFGRLLTVRGPYDSTTAPALTMQYFAKESPPRAVTTTRTSAPADYTGPLAASITTVTIVDGLGRPIQLRKTAVVDGVPGMTTSGLVQRDNLGRVRKSYQPFFTAGASTSFVTPTVTLATSTDYDELDRPTTITHPDGAVEHTRYAIAVAPNGPLLFRTQHLIPMQPIDRVREEYADHLGRVRTYVERPTANTSSATSYDYFATGELRRIVDAEGWQTNLTYDMRGLRTAMDNPDTGLREERYDLMGNRIALIEPNHRVLNTQITYVYQRDRLRRVDYPSKVDVTYEYGAPGASDARAGRVTRVTDETGSIEYFYGALGETRRSLRTVQRPNTTQALLFDHRFTHDSLGRLLRVRYPDGEMVTNAYDAGGQLASVTGAGDGWQRTYATGLRYDVFGNRTRMEVGKVVTTWTYEPARVRLKDVLSTIQVTNTKIQDLHYQYDPANNPTLITNTLAPLAAGADQMPGPSSLTLTYDGVNRLTRAVGQGQLDATRTTSYDLSFAYTPSHNIQNKTRSHVITAGSVQTLPPATNFNFSYLYATRPHLPDHVGTLHQQYDPSGNPRSRFDLMTGVFQTLVWDDDKRLVELTASNGISQRNMYDASGLRVRRESNGPTGSRTTIFASQYFDLEGEQASSTGGIKHIFAGELRIASVLGSYSTSATPSLPATPGIPYFLHSDHLGSTSVITDDFGAVHQSIEYFVDGEAWIDRAPTTTVNKYLFNGKPYDPETGFYDYGQRFYDPRTSLWLGLDPAFVDSPNKGVGYPLYISVGAFSGHNPARFRDVDGEDYPKTEAGRRLYHKAQFPIGPVIDPKGFNWDTLAIGNTEPKAALRSAFEAAKVGRESEGDRVYTAIANVSAGFGDGLLIGVEGGWFREKAGIEGVDENSGAYAVGMIASVIGTVLSGRSSKEHGSYTNTHESGKTYSGKGSRDRSQQSGRRQARKHDDPHIATDWTPAANKREAFKQESRRIDAQGGIDSPTNYNKVESPGKKYRMEDGEL